MDLSTFIISVLCLIDDRLKERRIRSRGPTPTLSDSEVLTIEIIGEFLGLDEDTQLFAYFRRHYAHYFPNLMRVHRTTFTRQAADLWKVKERLWQELLADTPHDPAFAICDSMPLPACLFARAYRCKRLRGEAAFGKDTLLRQTFCSFRCTLGSASPVSSPASRWPRPTPTSSPSCPNSSSTPAGVAVGDRNYWSPEAEAVEHFLAP